MKHPASGIQSKKNLSANKPDPVILIAQNGHHLSGLAITGKILLPTLPGTYCYDSKRAAYITQQLAKTNCA